MKLEFYNTAAQREAGSQAENMHLPKKSHTSFLKTLLLLALMLVGSVGVSWGQNLLNIENLFTNLNNGRGQWVCSNATIYWEAGLRGDGDANVKTVDSKQFLQLERDARKHIKIQFEKGKIRVGDKIQMEVIRCVDDQDMGFFTVKQDGDTYTVNDYNGQYMPKANYPNQNTVYTLNYTIEAKDINTVDENTENIILTGWWYNSTAFHSLRIYRDSYTVTFGPNNADWGTVTATANGNLITSGTRVADGTQVTFTATPKSSEYLTWGWAGDATNFAAQTEVTVTKDVNVTHNFTPGIKINAYPNNGTLGSINITGGGQSGTSIHVTPYPGTVTFTATPNAGAKFVGWYSNVEMTNLVTTETTLTYKDNDPEDDTNILRTTGELNRWAKFEATTKPFTVTANWTPTIPANAAGWGLATVTVKADGVDVDASEYTLYYEVVDGHLSLDNGSKNATVTGGFNDYETAHVKVTATPKDATKYTAGTVTFAVDIKKLAKPNITVNPKTVRIGESVTIGVTRETNFTNPHYEWTLSDNAKTCLYGYTDPISETQAGGTPNPTHKFVAKEPTSSPISVNLKFYSENGYYNNTANRMYEEANASGSNGITVKPVAVPTVTEDAEGVHFTYEQDYDVENGRVDAYLEYFVGEPKADNSNRVQVGFGDQTSTYTTKDIPQGIRIYVKSVIHYKNANNEDVYVASSEVQYVTDKPAVLPAVELMKQPRWANGVAKRYIPIGKIDENNTSLWPDGVDQGMGAIKENTMGYILNGGSSYTIDKADKGLLISQYGKTSWGWNEGKTAYIPKSAAFYMDVAGTLDVILFVENSFNDSKNDDAGDYNGNRRWIKVWYLNDQCKDGKPIQMASWGIVGKRVEGNTTGGNELRLHVRLPQLGTNGKTTLFFTYEGDGYGNDVSDTDHNLWIRGFMIKRPDLPNSIGRTDDLYNSDADNLTHMCVPTKNTPYVWSFEPKATNSAGNNIHTDGKDAVGFRPASDTNEKKNNENDGRIYVCGEKDDHLLIYSDNYDVDPANPVTPLAKEARPELDGRSNRDGDSHIELVRPTLMAGNNGNDDKFNPIRSNGLKVNVTGSGWFKVIAAAPYCDVKMRVLTSTNGGMSTIRVLKEFTVKKSSEMGWTNPDVESEFTAYLKAQVTDDDTYDADGATGDPEKKYMSLYVVFEAAKAADLDADGKVKGTSNYPQLNIHQMSWLNELPADYVFQREENPKLLTEWREVKRGGKTMLWWKTANDDDTAYPVLKENGNFTYNRLTQFTTSIDGSKGVKSPDGCASTTVPSYNAYWDIAAPASTMSHTENAYAGGNKVIYNDSPQYIYAGAGNTEFDLPVSGSFLRICAMENTYVIAHVLPGASGAKIYVLDETGSPIPSLTGNADDKKRLGYIAAMSNVTGENITTDGTIRIDFCANAGKEYFICANGASISLARLEVVESQYSQTKATTLALEDNANNSTAIAAAYDTKEFYRNATLKRKPASNVWFSIVLPFSLNEKKFKQIFGDDARCLHFTDVDTKTNTVKLTHHYYNMIVAGRPVFVRTSKSFTNEVIAMNDITLQAKEVRNIQTDNDFVFYASYDNAELVNYDLYMNNDNAVKYLKTSTGKASYPGMRAFIKNKAGYDFASGTVTTQGAAKTVFLSFFDEDESATTGIEEFVKGEFGENVVVVTKSTKVYDLSGRIVGSGAELGTLPAGVYVVNGKKYIVK